MQLDTDTLADPPVEGASASRLEQGLLVGVVLVLALLAFGWALVPELANVTAILAPYYLLRGSALQDRFFRTEGDYEDFVRSGMKDFNAWVMGDMFGGTFFHLLLGALIAAALGSVGGILPVALVREQKRRATGGARHSCQTEER